MHKTTGTTPYVATIKNKLASKNNNAEFAEFMRNKEQRQSFKAIDVSKRESFKGQIQNAQKPRRKVLADSSGYVHP